MSPTRLKPAPVTPEVKKPQWPRWTKMLAGFVFLLGTLVGLINYYNVDKTVTAEDRKYIQLYLPGVVEGSGANMSYEDQIRIIQRVQQVLNERTRGWMGIPEGQPREPKQLYLEQTGMCYDRSRVLEKMFLYLGFETRHLALFTREPYVHSYTTVLFHHVPSHAISEIKTKHGWLMVDSNDIWLSLDLNNEPVSMHQLQERYLRGQIPIEWKMPVIWRDQRFYNDRCIAVYGLYSRHGRFYPPYTSHIPDYRIRGLLYNFESK
jgi:hypothetical protein